MSSNLGRKFAIVGVAVVVAAFFLWCFDRTFNPFHLPSWGQAPTNYMEPQARRIIERIFFVLCPGLYLQIFTIGIGGWVPWFMWAIAAALNAPIYYAIGLGVAALVKFLTEKHKLLL